ncbi:PAS domain-containing hybrid sensor histidine kinase/response regulator [Desulfobacula phenolica]|uniref:histidine kinase n=1 Tax=Desulfobacula phenolica TaxID=90732 RepID=A0A1H2J8E6_9BACT|nr:PAS domain-containing sensor histidine kinase [Desulfobacula phenolica]SDU52680.1 PAS domain S-box-containing protein [Desulfobacula phenolica]
MEQNQYKELFNRSSNAILVIIDDKFFDCNAATLKLLGYSNKQELLNKHPSDFSPEKQPDGRFSHEKANDLFDIAYKKGSIRFEWDHKKADGTIFPVEVLLTVIPNGSKKTFYAVWRDISDKKWSEQILNSIINAISDPIYVKDETQKYIALNDALLNLVGLSKEDMMNKSIHDIFSHKKAKIIRDKDDTVFNSGIEHTNKGIITDAKGHKRIISTKKAVFTNEENKKILVGVIKDITEQVENYKEKEKLKNQLLQAQKMEAMGTLAGGIAHDFNNILSGIFGYAQLAKNHVNDPEKATIYINEIINGANKAVELVQQILTFTRKSTQKKKPLRIYIVVKEAIKLLRASIPVTITIKENIHSRAKVIADPGKIHQVVMNLCTNAYQAMIDTGGILSVGLKEIKIQNQRHTPRLNLMPGNYIRLEVKDTGQGMTRKTMNKIFEPYFTTKAANNGTGIGLSVVHGIVEEHNGYIEVDSRKGQGTSFKVFFPIIQEKTVLATAKPEKNILSQGSEKILLVDDNKNILDTTKKILEYHGYRVKSFSNVMDAFQVFKNNPLKFDLIISDVTMPGMTGDIFSRKVLDVRPDTPIILCSGFNENISEKELQDIGIKKFFQKPVASNELISEIQHIFSYNNEPASKNISECFSRSNNLIPTHQH